MEKIKISKERKKRKEMRREKFIFLNDFEERRPCR